MPTSRLVNCSVGLSFSAPESAPASVTSSPSRIQVMPSASTTRRVKSAPAQIVEPRGNAGLDDAVIVPPPVGKPSRRQPYCAVFLAHPFHQPTSNRPGNAVSQVLTPATAMMPATVIQHSGGAMVPALRLESIPPVAVFSALCRELDHNCSTQGTHGRECQNDAQWVRPRDGDAAPETSLPRSPVV